MSNLYDTGKPLRMVHENEQPTERVVEKLVVFPLCQVCGRQTRTVPCEWCSKPVEIQLAIEGGERKKLEGKS